jgi:hypothetical protein
MVEAGDAVVFREFATGTCKQRSKPSRVLSISAALTCLQCCFALYGTVLLFYMSPSVELMAAPDPGSRFWAGQIARHWKNYWVTITPPQQHQQQQPVTTSPSLNAIPRVTPIVKSDVCEREQINFDQKKSTDARMTAFKSSLFRYVLSSLPVIFFFSIFSRESHWRFEN